MDSNLGDRNGIVSLKTYAGLACESLCEILLCYDPWLALVREL